MLEFLLVIIAALLSVQTGAFAWIVHKVWKHETEITTLKDELRLCPNHFKIGGSE